MTERKSTNKKNTNTNITKKKIVSGKLITVIIQHTGWKITVRKMWTGVNGKLESVYTVWDYNIVMQWTMEAEVSVRCAC